MMQNLSDLDDDERRLIGPYLVVNHPSGNEYRGFCAECEDRKTSKSPSASYNFIRGEWHCMKNDCGGTINKLMNKLLKREKDALLKDADVIDMDARRKKPEKPLPTEQQIEGFMILLRSAGKVRMLQAFSERRGISIDMLDKFHIGWDNTQMRITVPVYDAKGNLINVRKYDPKSKSANTAKMLPWSAGYATSLFNEKSLAENDEIVLCEGEWDCIISEQHGIPTVTTTAGVGAFQIRWAAKFKDKHVFICFDEDEPGIKGATRTARMLRDIASSVYIMNNLATGKRDGDLTDFYLNGGTGEQFRALMEEARLNPFARDNTDHVIAKSGLKVSLEESQNGEYDEPLELDILIAGKQTPPYLAPKRIHATCGQDKGKVCATCPMAVYNGDRWLDTEPDDSRLLKFIESNENGTRAILRDLFSAACPDKIQYDIARFWTVEEVVAVQSLENRREETMTPMSRKIFAFGTYKSSVNSTARLVGHQVADPRTNRGVFHAWYNEATASNIDKFAVEPEDREELNIFQPEFGQTPLEKCKEIAEDLEANVTHIYGRSMLHVAYDIVWHSALDFVFMGKRMDKGWLDALVIGDTRTGKSETAKSLCMHYNAGTLKSCEGATFAGLVGGAQSGPGGHWMVTWGTIPLNDRRLVILDELSGLNKAGGESKGIIEQMSMIRSSGKAQLIKIVSEETSARTRLLWISNPIDGRTLKNTPGGGMVAVTKLIKNPEDIARYDFALAVSNDDVPSSLINSMKHKKVKHVYDSECCSKLVLWAWSRKANQIKFRRGAEEAIIAASEDLGSRYVAEPPLVQIENIRMKLARISVAIAARTFSSNKACDEIWVLPVHVSAAVEFLDWIYAADNMGYARHSDTIRHARAKAVKNIPRTKEYLMHSENGLLMALRAVMFLDSFRPNDFKEIGYNMDPDQAMNMLFSWGMVKRLSGAGGKYILEPPMIEILKQLEDYDG